CRTPSPHIRHSTTPRDAESQTRSPAGTVSQLIVGDPAMLTKPTSGTGSIRPLAEGNSARLDRDHFSVRPRGTRHMLDSNRHGVDCNAIPRRARRQPTENLRAIVAARRFVVRAGSRRWLILTALSLICVALAGR